MNPDPVAKLAKFTPASGVDAAELLFAAGRASARTFWGWKVAVAGLLLSNLALGAFIAFRSHELPPAPPPTPPATPAQPEPAAAPQPPQPPPSAVEEPWSYRTLMSGNLEQLPRPQPVPNLAPREPLTVLSGRSGELD
jgi:hypothetical protein